MDHGAICGTDHVPGAAATFKPTSGSSVILIEYAAHTTMQRTRLLLQKVAAEAAKSKDAVAKAGSLHSQKIQPSLPYRQPGSIGVSRYELQILSLRNKHAD